MESFELARLILETVPQSMRTIRNEMRKSSKDVLTVPQFRVLNRLSKNPHTNGDLAEWMGVSAPSMSRMVELLVKRGLIRRKQSGPDRRQLALTCTQKGMDMTSQIRESVQKSLTQKLSLLSADDVRALECGLRILKGMLV